MGRRSFRAQTGQFLAEGPQALREALRADLVQELFVTQEGARRHPDLVDVAFHRGCPVIEVADKTLVSITDTVTPQGLVAITKMPVSSLGTAIAPPAKLIAVLVQAQDPGNVGTIIRIADAAGADAVVITTDSADPFNSKSVRASAGSIFHLPVVTGVAVDELGSALRALGIAIVGAAGEAPVSILDADAAPTLMGPTAWFFGNEAHGLSEAALELCTTTLRIPIFGSAQSLNVGAAAAICLYASASAQRHEA